MVRTYKAKQPIAPPRSSTCQTLPERIKYLRAKQKPYMTQKQLSIITGVPEKTIIDIEKGDLSANNMKLNTLRRLGNALGCRVYINLKSIPSKAEGECQPLGPELPPPPVRTGKTSAANRRLALLHGQSPQRKYNQRARLLRQKETSGTPDLTASSQECKVE